jgi:RHS repeat-associated protein
LETKYSPRNLLANATVEMFGGENSYAYQYDGRGVRVYALDGTTPRYHLYSSDLRPLSTAYKLSAFSTVLPNEDFIWFGDRLVGGRSDYYAITDHLGTPFAYYNAAGAMLWHAEYEPFGEIYKMRQGPAEYHRLRFPGQERAFATYDGVEPTGRTHEVNYNIFRWYMPMAGRYTQADPIGLENKVNLFSYAAGNPMRYFDADGLSYVSDNYAQDNEAAVVCDGRGGMQPWVGRNYFADDFQRRCIGECIWMHELRHIQQIQRNSPDLCRGKRMFMKIYPSTQQEKDTFEREAYKVTIRCLLGRRQRANCKCQAYIDSALQKFQQIVDEDVYP